MITIKKPEEIKTIREGGKKLAAILATVAEHAVPGTTTAELDALAEKLIISSGGVPAFKHYHDHPSEPPFPTTLCTSVNNQVVHTPAGSYVLKDGDIIGIDIGMQYPSSGHGLFTDMAITVAVGRVSPIARKLLKVTKHALDLGIAQVKAGNRVSDISRAVQTYVEGEGFSVVRQLVGHGVGYAVHEDPRIPNYVDARQPVVELKTGMVIAIEPMVNVGDPGVTTGPDGWTVMTVDGALSAHFEHTVAVTDRGAEVLTAL